MYREEKLPPPKGPKKESIPFWKKQEAAVAADPLHYLLYEGLYTCINDHVCGQPVSSGGGGGPFPIRKEGEETTPSTARKGHYI
jgi:hypothetical protein